MKIAIIGANGKEGRLLVNEAIARGHDVTAVVRGENRSGAEKAIVKDVFDLTADDLKGFDAVLDAFGTAPETSEQHVTSLRRIADALSGTETRLLVVGGAGSLYTDETKKTELCRTPGFPPAFLPTAEGMSKGLKELRTRHDVKWTYISPAAIFDATAPKTGRYAFAGEVFTANAEGKSFISYADYASAMLDVLESGKHIGERISVYGL
ncbi:MAG: NAD(P)-bd-dom domain-containing protein [Burkholderia sp.]|jgi:uncharacterized protein